MSEWIKTAKVGDKVVCVKRGGWREVAPGFLDATAFPLFGGVYTILEIGCADDGAVFLRIEEVPIGYFAAVRFRPVQPRLTDISIFTRILNTAPADAEEMA